MQEIFIFMDYQLLHGMVKQRQYQLIIIIVVIEILHQYVFQRIKEMKKVKIQQGIVMVVMLNMILIWK